MQHPTEVNVFFAHFVHRWNRAIRTAASMESVNVTLAAL
jgi:hypothetical protein